MSRIRHIMINLHNITHSLNIVNIVNMNKLIITSFKKKRINGIVLITRNNSNNFKISITNMNPMTIMIILIVLITIQVKIELVGNIMGYLLGNMEIVVIHGGIQLE